MGIVAIDNVRATIKRSSRLKWLISHRAKDRAKPGRSSKANNPAAALRPAVKPSWKLQNTINTTKIPARSERRELSFELMMFMVSRWCVVGNVTFFCVKYNPLNLATDFSIDVIGMLLKWHPNNVKLAMFIDI
jgi:hypothetical protein